MEALFAGAVGNVAEKVLEFHGDSMRNLPSVVAGVRAKAVYLVLDTEGPFRTLMEAAIGKGLESIREELEFCERTLGKKYSGLAREACDAVDGSEDQLMTLALVQYRANAGNAIDWVTGQMELELRVSSSLQEPADTMLDRIVSASSVRVPQHTGRGLWWKVLEHCNRIAREVEFAIVNAARSEAMRQFNEIGAERRNG
jgi:hypothetical protein